MESNRLEGVENVVMLSELERVLLECCLISYASSAPTLLENPANAAQSLGAALEKEATQVLEAEEEHILGRFRDISLPRNASFRKFGPPSPTHQSGWTIQCAINLPVYPP